MHVCKETACSKCLLMTKDVIIIIIRHHHHHSPVLFAWILILQSNGVADAERRAWETLYCIGKRDLLLLVPPPCGVLPFSLHTKRESVVRHTVSFQLSLVLEIERDSITNRPISKQKPGRKESQSGLTASNTRTDAPKNTRTKVRSTKRT